MAPCVRRTARAARLLPCVLALYAAPALAQHVKVCDTRTPNCAAVKAASTAAVATDPAIVVQLNPAQPNLATPLNVAVSSDATVSAAPPCRVGGTKFAAAVVGQAAALAELMPATAGRAYEPMWIIAGSNTSTATSFALQTGTGSACGTTTTQLFPLPPASTSARYVAPANTAPPSYYPLTFGVVGTTAHALCVIGLATNTANVTVGGCYYTP